MSLSDLLVDYGESGHSQFDEHTKKQFTGPAKFATKIDPLQEGDYTIKPPSMTSFHKVTDHINPSHSPNSGVIQFSPRTQFLEEKNLMNTNNKELMKEIGQTNITNQHKEGINNFIKLVLAKSYFNRFVENMLQKSYVKKLSHFNLYQNTMLDDLRYIDSKHKVRKNFIGKICKKLRFLPIFDQSSYLVIGWQLLHILTIIIIFFWTPFNISFGITFDQVVFGTLTVRDVEFYFLFSIVVDGFIVINTSYIEKGIIIKQRAKIFINYVNTQGIYDLCSFASMLVAQQFDVNSSTEKLGWQLIPYAIYYCSRQFKLQARVHKLEEFFNFSGWAQDLIELIKLLFMVIYVGHLFACLWHGVAFYQIGFRKTWLEAYDVSDQDIFSKYNYAFYWAVQTMITVGYGDLTPQNNNERLCANMSMFLACGVFAFSFNSIGLMLSNLNSRQVLYKRSTNLLNSYLTKNQIKIELQSRIRNYYDYIFQEEQEINDEEVSQITTKLSSSLQEELNFEIRLNVMKTNKVLTKFSQKTLKQLSLIVEEVRYSPEDQILLQGTQDDCSLYIITKGTVSVLFQDEPQGRNTRVLSYLEKGESFGEYSFFTGLNRCASAKSIGFSRAYKIPRQQLLNCSFASMLVAQQFDVNSSTEKLGWQLIPYAIYYCSRQFKLQARVHKLEEFFNFSGWAQDLIELIKLLFMVIYVGHLFACLWHGVAFYQIGFRKTWLEAYDVSDQDIFSKYNYAFYWAVQTMITVGYGDLTPQNNNERLCANMSMFLACGVFAFSFNSIGLMLSNLNSRQVLYKRSTNLLNSYLTKNQIKIELQSRIRNYYDYIFQEEQEINDEEVSQITTKLSSSLQEELNFEIRLNVMKTNKVLTKFSQKTLKQLSLIVEEVRYSPEDQILLQGTQDDCSLYIITKGTVSVLFQDEPQGRNTRVLSYLEKGESFGEYSFFTGLNRCASAKSIGFSRAYKIPRQQLLNVLQTNQIDLERFCEVRDSILLCGNFQPAKLSCYSCKKFNHLVKDCPVLHFVADKEKVIKKEYYPLLQNRCITYKRKRSDRNYYPTLLEMKKMIAFIGYFQTKENQADNITIIDEELDISYEDNDGSPNEQDYSSLSKSYSKLSRQQSQNRSYSQYENNNNNTKNLQPIQESEDSLDSPSPNKKRNMQIKQTLQTAGFGVQDSLQNKIRNDDLDQNLSSFGNATPSIHDENKYSIKNDSLGLPSPIDIPGRVTKKRITVLRKQKREESYKPFSSQTKVEVNQDREKSQQKKIKNKDPLIDIPVTPSIQSVDYKRDSIDRKDDRRDQKRKTTKTKTNRSRTAKTHRTTKLVQDNPTQEISIPVFERQAVSMELEDFEVLKNFTNYFSWNNGKVVVARTMKILLRNLEKRRNFMNQFSFYTFNSLAIAKITRIKRKLKLIEDPPLEEKKEKKSVHPINKSMKDRRSSKRSTQTDDLTGLFQKKPQFGTQIQVFSGVTLSRFSRNELEYR
ncbi:unnamed protein product [Paramecium sonneborni]|uniref:Cyclic nucleotide-binding domain-containing protein n=1 Tax=Paramecium sonneborni TaxID=65129 RepID=A0A8S1QEE9_9CILI|nr:unnamed protein product [Paramecium sonneborni]